MAHFFALDVETANAAMSSICQIGVVEFDGPTAIDTWETLLDPQDYFDPVNIHMHGITPQKVIGDPTFEQIYIMLRSRLQNQTVVTHTAFDITALRRACEKYNLPELTPIWLDSARVARRHWEALRYTGYGLSNVAAMLGIKYQAHDAVEDARVAGLVVIQAMRESGLSLHEWQKRAYSSVTPTYEKRIKLDGNPEGPLYGENIVFTGALTISRPEAAQLAAQAGCNVQPGINHETTLLVVGIQDIDRLAGYNKSSKHRKAEQLIQSGQAIRIITEKDFIQLVEIERKAHPKTTDGRNLFVSIDTPIREFIDMDHRWRGPDRGLIWCWERGRLLAIENPSLAERAKSGELMTLTWKGGVPEEFKSPRKEGTLNYLAHWQGLAGKDLDIDTECPVSLTCAVTGVVVTYTKDSWKKAESEQ